eukprot:SAG22_NODE_10129_length_551_cov_1.154867_1_plen_89_part_00
MLQDKLPAGDFTIHQEQVSGLLETVADKTAGLSGRQLMQLVNSIQVEAIIQKRLTEVDVLALTELKLSETNAADEFAFAGTDLRADSA